MNETNMSTDSNVIFAILKLSRAMRRCPPDPGKPPFPPAIGRLLACVSENSGISSRELCEMLDLRPSSLSEMLSRAEQEGWITRTADEEDRRLQHVTLSEKGSAVIQDLTRAREADAAKKTACLTPGEKEQFCALCNKLSAHMESLAADLPEGMRHGPCGPRPPHHEPPFPKARPFPEDHPFPEDRPFPENGPFRKPGKPGFPPDVRFRC